MTPTPTATPDNRYIMGQLPEDWVMAVFITALVVAFSYYWFYHRTWEQDDGR